ncbi:hypothetical protein V6N13_110098 [Hibiscus sabdariffa]|uniref:Uncharacterized protein n=1 Tax=Hibiscus sabdariffa TaxID=183260 RepID=A0ABR2BTX1_9ROSI
MEIWQHPMPEREPLRLRVVSLLSQYEMQPVKYRLPVSSRSAMIVTSVSQPTAVSLFLSLEIVKVFVHISEAVLSTCVLLAS